MSSVTVSGCKIYLTIALKPQLSITHLQESPSSFLFHVAHDRDCTTQYRSPRLCAISKLGDRRTDTLHLRLFMNTLHLDTSPLVCRYRKVTGGYVDWG